MEFAAVRGEHVVRALRKRVSVAIDSFTGSELWSAETFAGACGSSLYGLVTCDPERSYPLCCCARRLRHCFFTAITVFLDLGRLVAFGLRSRRALAAENLFLRERLALFQEQVKHEGPRKPRVVRWQL